MRRNRALMGKDLYRKKRRAIRAKWLFGIDPRKPSEIMGFLSRLEFLISRLGFYKTLKEAMAIAERAGCRFDECQPEMGMQ